VAEPEPAKSVTTTTGTTVTPEPTPKPQNDWITTSSLGHWRGAENQPWNPIAYNHFDSNWNAEQLTCFCTKADKEGPWW